MNHLLIRQAGASWALAMFLLWQGWFSVADANTVDRDLVRVRVVDGNGQPIDDATVRIVGLTSRPDIGTWHQTPGQLTLPSVSSGQYEIAIQRRHRAFLHHDRALLVVAAPGYDLNVRELLQTRLRCGVPLDVTLKPQATGTITVVDDQGDSVAGARLAPAVWGTTVIPKYHGIPESAFTDADGKTQATWIDPARLSMVYLWSDSLGNQRLPVTRGDDGRLSVIALKTYKTAGRWTAESEPERDSPFFSTAITVASSPQEFSFSQGATQVYTWGTTVQRADGTLPPVQLTPGNLVYTSQMPSSVPLTTQYQRATAATIDEDQSYQIEWFDGIRVQGQIVDEHTGDPLSDLTVLHFSLSHSDDITDDDGAFQIWFAPGSRISYFPQDVLGRHIKAGGFYLYPQQLPVDGKLQLDPTPMQRMSAAIGKVIDHQGLPIAAAQVECQFKDERFTKTQTLYSDAEGEFRFNHVLENATVQLTAQQETMMTQQPVSALLSETDEVVLKIVPRHGVAIRGRVVDADGRPIQRVSVTVRTPQVIQQELYNGRDSMAVDLFGGKSTIATDQQGVFESRPIVDWNRDISVELNAPGYRTTATYWRDASIAGNNKTDLDFGSITMHPQWKTIDQPVQVIDADTKHPLADVRIACRGAYVEHQRHRSDADGRAMISIPDSTAVFAIHHDGYHPAVLVRPAGQQLDVVKLKRLDSGPLSRPLIRAASDPSVDAAALAGRMLQRFTRPDPSDTVHRISSYYRTLSVTDFDTALAELTELAKLPNMKSTVGMLIAQMNWLDADQRKRVLPLLDDKMVFHLSLSLADQSTESEERLEWLGEALVLARQQTGDGALASIGRLAAQLLEQREVEMAKEMLLDAYADHPKLAEVLAAGERQKLAGVARIFLPVYATVDPEKASELIELTAYADEIERLQTLAVRFAAEYGDQSPETLCKRLGIDRLSSRGMTAGYLNLKHRDVQRGLALAERCDDELGKADFLFELAKTSDADLQTKSELARQALQIMESPVEEAMIFQPRHWLAERIGQVALWDPDLAEEYLFASIWIENQSSRITPFFPTATLAIHLAPVNPGIAKALVEPCFDDWSWLFGQRDQSVMFSHALPLHAAAAIDPDWAHDLVNDLLDNHIEGNDSRKLLIVSGIAASLFD
ncbi:carboxypeptidase-like regulatory domain-containing protein [Stieleria mannarensis]|uniref:carboxypeptidase-like regulatory domain-containing protein n=1 Tax=Stieleria mannarensis TaxID=2755585 RepID=UPI0016016BE3|nr:carboxypeptidase-like regulatory domain-containing protein [Rhodopirellula sp. JC639]